MSIKKLLQHLKYNHRMRKYDRYIYDPHPNAVGIVRMDEDIVDFLINNDFV